MPRILIDLRMVGKQMHGIARYALELARRLPLLAPDWEFTALVGPDTLPSTLGPLQPRLPTIVASARFLSPLEQPSLAAALIGARLDLYHATSFSLPALWRGPLVATLHDANHLALPENYRPGTTAYYRLVVGPRARRAQALITVSEFSRAEVAEHLDLPPERLQVIPQGVDERFRPSAPPEVAAFRKRLALPPRFLLAIGNAKPHKNLEVIARIAPSLPVPVVLLAGRGAARRLGFPASTRELGEVPEEDLPPLYAAAEGLLFPSYYEGFGLPPLEAMACGCPVIASRAASLPEVCGEAAMLVEPHSPEQWREAALRICRDTALRATLSTGGFERAARYTWARCAQQTLAVYRRVLESPQATRA
ncbi:MAG TPA: glycosyltransferase family 1 protein [Myxococcaceae bacterium]|nr:glycosyltransferase family 1 protein [Myxococcaceae bacterium]